MKEKEDTTAKIALVAAAVVVVVADAIAAKADEQMSVTATISTKIHSTKTEADKVVVPFAISFVASAHVVAETDKKRPPLAVFLLF